MIFLKSYAKIKPLLGNIKNTIIFDEVCKCHAISKKNNNQSLIEKKLNVEISLHAHFKDVR